MRRVSAALEVLGRAFPGLDRLRGYQRSWWRRDVLAGITVAAYLVPQVMAYAGLAGLAPVAGLWAMLPAIVLYAFLGSSQRLSVGPESTTALMTATVVAPLAGGDPGRYATLAAALAVVVGVLAIGAWCLRLGFVADLLSQPILVGYLAGVAVVMIVGQLERTTGVPVEGDGTLREIVSFLRSLDHVHAGTVVLAAVSLVFLFAMQWRFPRGPGPLLAVLLGTAAVVLFGLESAGIEVVGDVPAGLPGFALPSQYELGDLVLPALGVLLVGYTDNVLTARAFAERGEVRKEEIDGNRELLALGTANLGAGLFHGFPVSSSGSRTAIAVASGARTQAYSLAALATLGCVLLFLHPLLARFPMPTLGAIVIYAAVRLVDVAGFSKLAAFRQSELALAVAALAGVLAFDILYGILVAVGLSVLDLLARVARPHDAVLGRVPGVAGMHDVDDYPDAEVIDGLVIYRYDSPLFFANAHDFKRRALAAVDHHGPAVWFVLNVEAIIEVDSTGLAALDEVRAELSSRGIVFALARVKQDLLHDLRTYGLADKIGNDRLFPTLPTAVTAFERAVAGAPRPNTRHPNPPEGPSD
ncbi:SulP family inorganic anion transporter [Actinomadura macra]|uniref:SulP family inorganic anion transporter n=1 Tax=Actinomadura macra TaxID=46164 RepID=UPI00082B3CF1|nr:sulfate permease [Actinomadura macra]